MATSRRPVRQFYSIGEVCAMMEVKPHVLRYWEEVFPELSPAKNRAGMRVYGPRELDTIAAIRQMLQVDKFTVEGARERLARLRDARGGAEDVGPAALDDRRLGALRRDLERVLALLEPPKH